MIYCADFVQWDRTSSPVAQVRMLNLSVEALEIVNHVIRKYRLSTFYVPPFIYFFFVDFRSHNHVARLFALNSRTFSLDLWRKFCY